MEFAGKTVALEIAGLGIILYSPKSATHIARGSNYLRSHYLDAEKVQRHIQKGTIVGFGTCSSGRFLLTFHKGYPTEERIRESRFTLRLALRCEGGEVCCRDLYDLVSWEPECPPEQSIQLDDGIYHVTLCSNLPASGRLGDGQTIDVFLARLDEFPKLAADGVPTLCI